MSGPAPHGDSARLTAEERARLRPSVDVAALERLLGRLPPEARRLVMLHFARERTLEDFRAALADSGGPEALRDLERFVTEPPPATEVHPATGPGTVSYVVIPTDNFSVNVSPPEDDPELRALWDAIEPRMITGSAAFERVLAALRPQLDGAGFELVDERDDPQAFGSRYATFSDGAAVVRLTWDGRERWFVLEADPEPRRSATGQPIWVDLTLQRFDPARADDRRVAEVVEDVTAALRDFLD